jgi:D-alanine-D-alanine ligase
MKKLRVGVFLGGMSSEREVSLNSGRNVFDNLDRETYDPKAIFMDKEGRLWVIPWQLVSQNTTTDITERLKEEARRISYEGLKEEVDFAFISLHGKFGEDGCMQGLLELLGIPYTGPGVLASALGMDKHIQQRVLRAAGIGVPQSVLIHETEWQNGREEVIRSLLARFNFPVFTKPPREGSSIGVTLVRDEASLARGIEDALKWDRAVLVEEFLDGIEFSSIILEEEGDVHALELTEITPQSDYFTYDDKYMPLPEVHAAQEHRAGCGWENQTGSRSCLPGAGFPVLRPDRRFLPQGRPDPHHRSELLLRHGPLLVLLRAGGLRRDASLDDPQPADRKRPRHPPGETRAAVAGSSIKAYDLLENNDVW